MSNKILVTDSLFIFDEHVKQLEDAGFEVERLDKPEATEEELCEAVKGKLGYILGGIEKVTKNVIDAADKLKVIGVTGIGYKDLVPVWEYATEKGIAIVNTPDAPTQAVAEWALGATLLMARGFIELGLNGPKDFMTTSGLYGSNIGILGYGRIGQKIADMAKVFQPSTIKYFSAHKHDDRGGATYVDMDELLQTSDVVFVCVSKDAGEDFIDQNELSKMKDGALLISFLPEGIINEDALFSELKSGRLRAVSDHPMSKRFNSLPTVNWYSLKSSNAFNTISELKICSDSVVSSTINVLKTGQDENRVN